VEIHVRITIAESIRTATVENSVRRLVKLGRWAILAGGDVFNALEAGGILDGHMCLVVNSGLD
jgi:hypothetical protein